MANYAFEKHKECVRNLSISASTSPEDVIKVLEKYWDDMIMDVASEISDTREKEVYRSLISQSKYAVKISECFKPVIEQDEKGVRLNLAKNTFLFLAFAVAIFCTVWYAVIPTNMITGSFALATLIALGISVLCGKLENLNSNRFIGKILSKKLHGIREIAVGAKIAALLIAAAGSLVNFLPLQMSLFRGRIMLSLAVFIALDLLISFVQVNLKKERQNVRAKTELDTDMVFKVLEEVSVGIDASASRIMAVMPAPVPNASELGFIRELSQIKSVEQVYSVLDYYVAKNGITKVEYSPETAYLFNLMPSTETRTLEPALIKDDEVIYTGMALIKEGEA